MESSLLFCRADWVDLQSLNESMAFQLALPVTDIKFTLIEYAHACVCTCMHACTHTAHTICIFHTEVHIPNLYTS